MNYLSAVSATTCILIREGQREFRGRYGRRGDVTTAQTGAATSRGMPPATRSWKRPGSVLEPPEGGLSCLCLNFGLPASGTVGESILSC